MTFPEALLLSLALCVDSLVVSATTAFRHRPNVRQTLLMAFIFGLCQAAFPLVGALIGDVARPFIEAVDHWVAFLLLAFVGGRMIWPGNKSHPQPHQSHPHRLSARLFFLLGIATSIDALAVGIGLGLDLALAAVVRVVLLIGATTFAVSLVGAAIGRRRLRIPERTANLVAGLVLFALGLKILLEHLLA